MFEAKNEKEKKANSLILQLTLLEDPGQFVEDVLQSQCCEQIHLIQSAPKSLQHSSLPESQKSNTQP